MLNNTQLLTIKEANELVNEAWRMVEKHTMGSYRFGQALTNLLPIHLYSHFNATDKDFYYERDSDKVLLIFYRYYIQE